MARVSEVPRNLTPAAAFGLVAGVLILVALASSTPSPLYTDYATRWHFSTAVLTTVYAIYPLGALAGLVVLGRISDEVGRRPVLFAALVALLGSLTLFALARSTWWLLAARLVQGLATGPLLSACGAALLDLEPHQDTSRAGLVNSTSMVSGIGVGAIVSAALVQLAPDPRVTPYLLLIALGGVTLIGVRLLPEPVIRASEPKLRPQWPHVPQQIRGPFALAGAAAIASFTIGGLYLALAPGLASKILGTDNHLAGGAAVFALGAAAGVAQVARRAIAADEATRQGSLAMAIGLSLIIAAMSLASAAVFWIGCVVTGAGMGVAFMGAGRTVADVAPVLQRAGLMSAFYVVAYLSLAVPAIVAGLVATAIGLEPTFRIFGGLVIVLALATAASTRAIALQPIPEPSTN